MQLILAMQLGDLLPWLHGYGGLLLQGVWRTIYVGLAGYAVGLIIGLSLALWASMGGSWARRGIYFYSAMLRALPELILIMLLYYICGDAVTWLFALLGFGHIEVDGPVAFPVLKGVPEEADLQRLSVMMCDPQRPTTIVPGRGNHRRWEFMLLPGEDDAEMMQPEQVARLVAPYLETVPHRIVRASTYRFHGLVAEQWQDGAVFLAGDAAHQTPPFFGQGMCHGFRDVANLAWKMAAIVQKGADSAILDTYQPERDAHVRSVIGAAVGAGRYICELDPAKAAVRDAQFRAAAKQAAPETAADLIPAIQTGIVHTGTSGAGERFIQSRIGDRLLDDVTGGGWRLFVHGAPVQHDPSDVTIAYCDDLADAGAVRDWLTTRGVKSVLVRPDHYVFGTTQDNGISLLNARCAALGLTQNIHMEIA